METNQFIKATVGIVVVFLVIGAVAIPIIGGFTESSPGVEGTNQPRNSSVAAIPDDGTILDYSDGSLTINGESVDLDDVTIISIGKYLLSNSSSSMVLTVTGEGETQSSCESFNLTYNNDVVSGTISTGDLGQIEVSENDPYAAVYAMNGIDASWAATTLISWDDEQASYINADDPVFIVFGNSGCIKGTIDNLIPRLPSFMIPDSYGVSTAPTDGDALEVTGVTPSSNTLLIPSTYYIELPVEPQISGPVADMVNLVPLLLVVGLIIAAVAAFITLKSRGGGA